MLRGPCEFELVTPCCLVLVFVWFCGFVVFLVRLVSFSWFALLFLYAVRVWVCVWRFGAGSVVRRQCVLESESLVLTAGT